MSTMPDLPTPITPEPGELPVEPDKGPIPMPGDVPAEMILASS